MQEITIYAIADGQRLAEDVRDESGSVLLAAGTVLSRAHVDALERRGVFTVKIEDSAKVATAPPSTNDLAGALRQLEHMFEGMDGDPIMGAIYAAARQMLESAMRGAPGGGGRDGAASSG